MCIYACHEYVHAYMCTQTHTQFVRLKFRNCLLAISFARCHLEGHPSPAKPISIVPGGLSSPFSVLLLLSRESKESNVHSGTFQIYLLWLLHVSNPQLASMTI